MYLKHADDYPNSRQSVRSDPVAISGNRIAAPSPTLVKNSAAVLKGPGLAWYLKRISSLKIDEFVKA
jgi:hypothetical protein